MENLALAFWVCLFIAVPIVALVLARRQRMKRHATGAPHPHAQPPRHRHEPHQPRRDP